MKYNKDLFINNVKYLISYDYEPEITIRLKDDSSLFVIAYKDCVDITIGNDETIKFKKIEDVFNYIDFDSIVEIEGDIDFEFPIEVQSIVRKGDLWIDAVSPTQEQSIPNNIIINNKLTNLNFFINYTSSFKD